MKLRNTIWLISLPTLLMAQQPADSNKVRFTIDGYIKNMPSLSFTSSFDTTRTLNLFHHRMRTKLELPGNLSLKMEFRNRFFSGSQLQDGKSFGASLDRDDGLI
ncbi:MAG TPA: hypothetical protein VLL95_00620, partial [Phnomibacter sp.]|nr:hypothetical protein [Phnomibacter sp.]